MCSVDMFRLHCMVGCNEYFTLYAAWRGKEKGLEDAPVIKLNIKTQLYVLTQV